MYKKENFKFEKENQFKKREKFPDLRVFEILYYILH